MVSDKTLLHAQKLLAIASKAMQHKAFSDAAPMIADAGLILRFILDTQRASRTIGYDVPTTAGALISHRHDAKHGRWFTEQEISDMLTDWSAHQEAYMREAEEMCTTPKADILSDASPTLIANSDDEEWRDFMLTLREDARKDDTLW